MQVGDLVLVVKRDYYFSATGKKMGIITELSEPTPMFSHQTAVVTFNDCVYDGISTRLLEVISESR